MALVVNMTCTRCGRNQDVVIGSGEPQPRICPECEKAEDDRKSREFFHGLDGLTTEERLRRLEEILYDAPWEKLYRSMNARY